ncbi:MAG: ABC transporter ATP-binding protein [Acidobacteria bacterium]|nr:ABC transporter ATP-binding protein [Acidobacteriota bacterium]
MEAAINIPINSTAQASVATEQMIIFEDVSKFYGEILGVNRVNLSIAPGITSLVGPNGSGKTTLMNLMTGLIQPTRGRVKVLDFSPSDPEVYFRHVGYCSQFDSFPAGHTGYEFIYSYLRVQGYGKKVADQMTWQALERVGLTEPAKRKVAGYSKGMRQRVRLAQSIAHHPTVIVLDEPLNGLDPMARADAIRLFRELANSGLHLIISSHILHEVNAMSDRVIFIESGYVKAAGDVEGVRNELEEHPLQILVRCDQPSTLAARLFQESHIVEVRIHDDRMGMFVKTRNTDMFYELLHHAVLEYNLNIETVATVDNDLNAVYHYLIGARQEGE